MGKSKEPVRLRMRKTSTGLASLYLDIYMNGHRSYEYLKLYLVPERSRADREKNRETRLLAESIRAKRLVEIQNGLYGFRERRKQDVRFFDYYKALCEKRKLEDSTGNYGNWISCLHHLQRYDRREGVTFAEITEDWVQGFRNYLENKAEAGFHFKREHTKGRPLSQNSKASYFNKLRACLNQAVEDGIIEYNPMRSVGGFKQEDSTRMYLTLEEVRLLAQTPCKCEEAKRAFLFSCLTGLRRSDIERLKWGDVYEEGGFTRIIYRQKKTGGQEYLDLASEAVSLMGKRSSPAELVFGGMTSRTYTNYSIKLWVADAGIKKDITFHCARHTFATLMLSIGTDIYTVSKLLGHRELATTQIYAKVLDKNKQEAVSRIPSVLLPVEVPPSREEPER